MSTFEPDLPYLQRNADHWNAWRQGPPFMPGPYKDWGDHPIVFQAIMRHLFGQTVFEEAVAFEHQLISSGVLNSDFRFLVAKSKTTGQHA